MKDIKHLTAKVIDTERKGVSYYGNPRYLVTLQTPEGETVKAYTKVNSMLAYGITNTEHKEFKNWAVGYHYNKLCMERA